MTSDIGPTVRASLPGSIRRVHDARNCARARHAGPGGRRRLTRGRRAMTAGRPAVARSARSATGEIGSLPMSKRPLFTVFPSRSITPELWQRFVDRARAEGLPPGPALSRLIRRYLGEPDDEPHSQRPDE